MSHPARCVGLASGDPIVFVAGFGDNGSMFVPLARTALGKMYSLVLPDLPGFGGTLPVAGELSLGYCGILGDSAVDKIASMYESLYRVGDMTCRSWRKCRKMADGPESTKT